MRSLFPFKIQAADSFGVNFKEGYNGDLLLSRPAASAVRSVEYKNKPNWFLLETSSPFFVRLFVNTLVFAAKPSLLGKEFSAQ